MAEDSIILPAAPNCAEADGGNTRRLSSSSNSREKIVPHYLRASTGSCHDFCKYGKKHAFEEKARRPFSKKNIKKPPDALNLALPEIKIPPVAKPKFSPSSKAHMSNASGIKSEALTKSVDSQMPLLAKVLAKKKTSPEALLTKSVDGQISVTRESIAKRKTSVELLKSSVDSQSSVASESWNDKKKSGQGGKETPVVKRTVPSLRSTSSSNGMNRDVSTSSEKLDTPLRQTSPKPKELKLLAGRASLLKPSSFSDDSIATSGGKNRDIKKIQKSSPKGDLNKVQGSPRALVPPKTTSIAVRRGLASPRASLSLKTSLSGVRGGVASPRSSLPLKTSLSGVRRVVASHRSSLPLKTSPSGVNRGVASPRASLSLRPSLSRTASLNKKHKDSKVSSSSKSPNNIKKADAKKPESNRASPGHSNIKGTNEDVVQEKTLHVIRMETGNKCLESDYNENLSSISSPSQMISPPSPSLQNSYNEEDEEGSEYSVTEGEDFSEYEESEEEAETLEGDKKGMHVKVGMIPSKDMDSRPMKLRFRRGKVVDIQSENNGPRRLKFRRGRMLGENQNLKADVRKSFKRTGADSNTIDGNDSEKVVLRHQEVHGKKDAQGLFNNVIEETASKLVETRKSKVKALVGAFETVISLQDSKPSASTTS